MNYKSPYLKRLGKCVCPECGELYYSMGIARHRGSARCRVNYTRKRGFTFNSIRNTVNKFKAVYPDREMVSEMKVLDLDLIRRLVPEAPQNANSIFGVPILEDSDVPANKIKVVYRDGRVDYIDL